MTHRICCEGMRRYVLAFLSSLIFPIPKGEGSIQLFCPLKWMRTLFARACSSHFVTSFSFGKFYMLCVDLYARRVNLRVLHRSFAKNSLQIAFRKRVVLSYCPCCILSRARSMSSYPMPSLPHWGTFLDVLICLHPKQPYSVIITCV